MGVVDDDFNLAGGKPFNGRKHKEMELDNRSEKMLHKAFGGIIYFSLQEPKCDGELSNTSKIAGGYSRHPFMVYIFN